ncbi:AI-2E family transporter [Thalassospira sp. GB04J01]|uniref:AI-2E family transporter n=1 Tax=Thalassospira sp. GB04J01 TaxID=1485225 RepID=UPI000C9A4034|nr:AI-2E family transporter [Thalassospira sp. GB04J01]|tara:strand:- start:49509 stop:50651 length:1143 start_codon:yes stop_codon:yes gene_type:complete
MSDPIAAQEDSLDQTKANDARQAARARAYRRARTISVIGTFGVLSLGCIYIAQDLLFPITLAFLLSLVFSPVVRTFARARIPRVLTAFTIVLGLTATAIAGVYGLSGPVSGWIDEAPQIERQLRLRLADLGEPLDKLRDAQKQVSEATDQNNEGDDVQKVVVAEPNLISQAAQGAPGIATGIALMLVLLLFILSGGDLVYEKMVRALPTFGDRRKGLRIAHDVEREVSRYLATISAINIILGIVIGTLMAVIGMPNPFLWGVAAAVLNFVPVLGALCGVMLVGVVALVSVQTTSEALLAPALYLACTALEGQLITPALVGNRLRINSIAIILAIAFWGWLWGFVGVLVAVPLLIVTSVIANHVEGLGGLRELLGPHVKAP